MRCNNCGAEIMDGAPACQNCGAPVPTMGTYPGAGMGATAKSSPIPTEFFKFITFGGAGLVFLGTVIPRLLYMKSKGESESVGLFSSGSGALKVWAIFLIIVAGGMVALELVPAVKDMIKGLPFWQFYLPGLGLLSLILIMCNSNVKEFRSMISLTKSMNGLLSAFGGSKVSGGWGISFWLILLGLIAIIARAVLGFLYEKEN
ncbi:zinc-ribbon domain-containing protein [Eubacterium ruminantium]|nr:zinc-ribbon domain-containing protein [Eubacterium ruminantium]